MPRKKITFDTPKTESTIKKTFIERDSRMITSEKMYQNNDKKSLIVGVAMAGEIVRVLEPAITSDDMTKIRTSTTNRIGYVNPKSIL